MSQWHVLEDIAAGRCALRDPDWNNPQKTIGRLAYKLSVNGVFDKLGRLACERYVISQAVANGVDESQARFAMSKQQFNTDTRHIDLRQYVTGAKKQSSNEYAAPCPKCGGEDRFHLKQTSNGWECFCRRCTGAENRWMDPIGFLQWRDGLSFQQACQSLGLVASDTPTKYVKRARTLTTRFQQDNGIKPPKPPKKRVAGQFEAIARHCHNRLSKQQTDYLRGRGVDLFTAIYRGLGYSNGEHVAGKYVPQGIVIPCWQGKQVSYIKIRGNDGYKQVKGGSADLYVARDSGENTPAIITETELDALMLATRARQRKLSLSIYATGSVSWCRDKIDLLNRRHALWTAFDNDDAGSEAAVKWGAPKLRFEGKDIGDVYTRGGWGEIDKLLFDNRFSL